MLLWSVLLPTGFTAPSESHGEVIARTGDRSVVLHWAAPGGGAVRYKVFRATTPGGPFQLLASLPGTVQRYADFKVTNGYSYYYTINAQLDNATRGVGGMMLAKPHPFQSDEEFLELVQATAFDYFWNESNPVNGLVKDRSTTNSFSSIAATGFGLSAVGIGIDHGWISREEGAARVLATQRMFWNGLEGDASADQIGSHGWFYHFLKMDSATRFGNVELSSIDTALLIAGMLDAREYFDGAGANEVKIRELAELIYARIDFPWMTRGDQVLSMGWKPEGGFLKNAWRGYNEGMILYILGLGSPTHPLSPESWAEWTKSYNWNTNGGESYVEFGPLFGHQYSHCWIDFRGQADRIMRARGLTYFENSRRATRANRAFCINTAQSHPGFGSETWGLTASDGPGFGRFGGYAAHGATLSDFNDGTLAPTAAGGSVPFAPEIAIPCMRHLYDTYRTNIWTAYGFRDAFNLEAQWWDPDVLGIDQGPMLIMIENYRSERVWKRFMKNPAIQRGLAAAGFRPIHPGH